MVIFREILRLQSLGHDITQTAEAIHSSIDTVRGVGHLVGEKWL